MNELDRLKRVVAVCQKHGATIDETVLAAATSGAACGERWCLVALVSDGWAAVGVEVAPRDDAGWRLRVSARTEPQMERDEAVTFARCIDRAVDLHTRIAAVIVSDDEAEAIGQREARNDFRCGASKRMSDDAVQWTVGRALGRYADVLYKASDAARIVDAAVAAFRAEFGRLCAMSEAEAQELAERRFEGTK